MTTYVYVQMNGIEKPAKIEADKVDKVPVQSSISGDHIYKITLKDKQVGEFRGPQVLGWWIEVD
jgi:hypothetical protein